jgi:hypothetical protein
LSRIIPAFRRSTIRQKKLLGRAKLLLQALDGCGCSLILTGHLHKAYSGDARPYHIEMKRSILVFQAGTAIRHRRRGEAGARASAVLGPEYRPSTAENARDCIVPNPLMPKGVEHLLPVTVFV